MAVCRAQAILALMRDPERLARERAELAAKGPRAFGGIGSGQPTGFGSGTSPAQQRSGGYGSGPSGQDRGAWESRADSPASQQLPEPRCPQEL